MTVSFTPESKKYDFYYFYRRFYFFDLITIVVTLKPEDYEVQERPSLNSP